MPYRGALSKLNLKASLNSRTRFEFQKKRTPRGADDLAYLGSRFKGRSACRFNRKFSPDSCRNEKRNRPGNDKPPERAGEVSDNRHDASISVVVIVIVIVVRLSTIRMAVQARRKIVRIPPFPAVLVVHVSCAMAGRTVEADEVLRKRLVDTRLGMAVGAILTVIAEANRKRHMYVDSMNLTVCMAPFAICRRHGPG